MEICLGCLHPGGHDPNNCRRFHIVLTVATRRDVNRQTEKETQQALHSSGKRHIPEKLLKAVGLLLPQLSNPRLSDSSPIAPHCQHCKGKRKKQIKRELVRTSKTKEKERKERKEKNRTRCHIHFCCHRYMHTH